MKLPTPKFELESTVYPRLCPEADTAGIVTGYIIRPGGHIAYLVTPADGDEKERLACELTEELAYTTASGGAND